MRYESSATSISWIPSEAVAGMAKLPFGMGVAHYDDPPPDRLVSMETMHRADMFREANELQAGSTSKTARSSTKGTRAEGGLGSLG